MKRYLRLLCLLMSSVLLSLTLAACGGGVTEAPTEGTSPATNPSEETTPPCGRAEARPARIPDG